MHKIGINDTPCDDGYQVYDSFKSSVTNQGERYEVTLPWKDNHLILQTDEKLAHARLNSTLSKLRKDESHLKAYNCIIREQLKSGFFEKTRQPVVPVLDSECHYLSHHAIIKES